MTAEKTYRMYRSHSMSKTHGRVEVERGITYARVKELYGIHGMSSDYTPSNEGHDWFLAHGPWVLEFREED